MKVAFCASEAVPFAKTGGLADVSGALPLALKDLGVEVTLFIPAYKGLLEKFDAKPVTDILFHIKLEEKLDVYFVNNGGYFSRSGIYGDQLGDYKDNLERFHFFCSSVLYVSKYLHLNFDLFHCQDWHTALIPVLLQTELFSQIFPVKPKTVLTIHNLAYQGVFRKEGIGKIDLNENDFHRFGLEFHHQLNLLKGGIVNADYVTTVSPRYLEEIQTVEFGCGLDGVLKEKSHLAGILNGLDKRLWNPSLDHWLVQKYDATNCVEGKRKNKQALLSEVGLKFISEHTKVLGFVGRITHQKGIDLIIDTMEQLMTLDVQIVIQGVGDEAYYAQLQKLAEKFPERLSVNFAFEERLAHLIYAGSDLYLMPSVFEPCGLSQMIALTYGTVPVVHKIGGLADTIEEFNPHTASGNGFVFKDYSAKDFLNAVRRAINALHNEDQQRQLLKNAFQCDFSWKKSAQKYKELYQCALSD